VPNDDEAYGLKPLPEVEFIGLEASKELNKKYVSKRKRYRKKNPLRERTP
jgi:hypothetical protein